MPAASSFRAGYAYSNAGFTAAALAAAKPTGKSWEEVAEEKLYRPLGMSVTSSRYADFLRRANRSELHTGGVGNWAAKAKRDATAQAPAGAVSGSARDLAKWMRLELGAGMFEGKQLISAEAIAATHVPLMARGKNPVTGADSFYGLGWNIEYRPLWPYLGPCRCIQRRRPHVGDALSRAPSSASSCSSTRSPPGRRKG